MVKSSRRAFVMGGVATIVASLDRTADAQVATKLRVSAIPIDLSGAPYYAQAEGFFLKHNLDVDIVTMTNGSSTAAAVIGGSLDIGSANMTSIATAHDRGIPFVLVAPSAAYSSKEPTGSLMTLQSSSIHVAKDLVGKLIAIANLHSLSEVTMRAWLDQNGVPSDSVKYVETPFGDMGPALAAGRVDAVLVEEPLQSGLLAHGGRIVANVNDAIGSLWLEGGFFCTLDYAKAHSDVVRRFSDAIADAASWANANHEASAKVLETVTNQSFSPNMRRAYYPERLNAALLQPVIDASAKYGLIKATFPASDVIAPGLLH